MELIQEADRSKWMAHTNHNIRRFTQGDIERMTNNYRTSLGRGAFGEVYEGVLEDGSMVAVKRLIGNVKEFAKELIIHREVNHKNVVRLIGYCVEENALMLVMEYVFNGNLNDVLHDDNRPIPLDIRIRIAIECAEALAYLHSHMYTQVIHRDIKPANILLDSNFHVKLSDFGISRLANTEKKLYTENVIGSIGYMDPLFAQDGCFTSKSDVYSFGVVLIELITRKKATTVFENANIVCAFTNALPRGIRGVRGMFDAEIASKNNMKLLEGFAKLASECLTMERDKRPEMIAVAERLRVLQKSSQDQGRQRVDLFSWVRKSTPASPRSLTVPAKTLSLSLFHGFSLADMKAMTNNFDMSRLLGKGGHDTVYLGLLEGNIEVAVKVAISFDERSKKEFSKEILILSQINHKNIVKLLGFCVEAEVPMLVLEFCHESTLFNLIHANRCRHISLATRLRIAYESAEALYYLHFWASPPIIHGDVKSSNILIDSNNNAKIYGFGGSILAPPDETQFVTMVRGTMGYVDPEYMQTCQLTEKSDVYNFGVILLELLTRKRALNPDGPESEITLTRHFLAVVSEERLEEMLDDEIKNDENMEVLEEMAELARRCLEMCGVNRPSMKEVSVTLDRLRQVTQHRSTQHSLEMTEFSLGELSMA